MPWPKGQKRVGHVNKDGQPHRKKGEGRAQGPRITIVTKPDPSRKTTVRTDVDPDRIEKAEPLNGGKTVKPLHGGTGRPIIEVCPNCTFAYADGGYCPECGWTEWPGRKSK